MAAAETVRVQPLKIRVSAVSASLKNETVVVSEDASLD